MSTIDRVIQTVLPMAAAAVLLAACQAVPQPPPGVAESRPADAADLHLPEGRTYRVSREDSELRIVLFPAGPLARFGHPHVIGGTVIEGTIVLAEDPGDSGLRLEVDVPALQVDLPGWRMAEGFEAELAQSDIDATRRNMLSEQVLDARAHPVVVIESIGLRGPVWQPDMEVRITLRGVARELTVPVALNVTPERLSATGRFVIRQSDFGIEPFSVAGGRLQVADELLIRFRIRAEADPP
ncbi:YceI family protein [Thioalkalivibrio thiocyanodenitrificans]|uniref:YceI family protein n=1 Tax=Thioalkalivibrio thiocyanodenitrificans TaxID=243063 RepID=UPI000A030C56|nr:YceI family protein [Thioalkalivibrio thiocyanodenitrificans]